MRKEARSDLYVQREKEDYVITVFALYRVCLLLRRPVFAGGIRRQLLRMQAAGAERLYGFRFGADVQRLLRLHGVRQ